MCGIDLVLFSAGAFAQSDKGTIGGFVKDSSGAVVPGATVLLTNEATGETHQATADSQGHYTVTNLTAGNYTLSAEVKGFKKYVSNHNTLGANTTLDLDAPLTIGAASEEVTVSATAEVLQTESAAVQAEITGKQVSDQELNGRNPLYMGSLVPGLRSGSTLGDFNFAVGGGNPFQINGSRAQDTMVIFDGAPAVRTRGNGAIIGVASVDATQEIQVITTDYQAEYGDAAGGQIRMVTKSGTRDFHGSAYEYLRNSAMNANTWVRNQSRYDKVRSALPVQQLRIHIRRTSLDSEDWCMDRFRNKFFFFVNEDWIRYRFTDSQTQAVPTVKMRTGDFSEFLSTNPWLSGVHQIYDPATCPRRRKCRLCGVYRQYHSPGPAQRERPGNLECVSGAYAWISFRNSELDCPGGPPHQPAKAGHQRRLDHQRPSQAGVTSVKTRPTTSISRSIRVQV